VFPNTNKARVKYFGHVESRLTYDLSSLYQSSETLGGIKGWYMKEQYWWAFDRTEKDNNTGYEINGSYQNPHGTLIVELNSSFAYTALFLSNKENTKKVLSQQQ